MRRTNIYLDDEQCRALDQLATAQGTSRAALIRRLIDEGLADDGATVDDDIAALEASFGGAPDLRSLQRGEDDRARHLRRVGAVPQDRQSR